MDVLTLDLAPPPPREEFAADVWREYARLGYRVTHSHLVDDLAALVQPSLMGSPIGSGSLTRVIVEPCPTPAWFEDPNTTWGRYARTMIGDGHRVHSVVLVTESPLDDPPTTATADRLPVTALTLTQLERHTGSASARGDLGDRVEDLLLKRWMRKIRSEYFQDVEPHGCILVNLRTGKYVWRATQADAHILVPSAEFPGEECGLVSFDVRHFRP